MLTKGMLHTTAGHASSQSELNVAAAISAVILLGLAFSRVQICIVGCFLSASILHTWLLPAMMHRVCCCCCCCCQPPKKPKVKAEKAAAAGADENGDPVDGECRRQCSPVTMSSLVLCCSHHCQSSGPVGIVYYGVPSTVQQKSQDDDVDRLGNCAQAGCGEHVRMPSGQL
jgi:hypothetical protein